ncbi:MULTISPECIES: DUF1127 domain-containing protein [Hoeflea]|jgi:uncharacterized protein YjiS (DUF1127 family)|uniref:DUF1127 domain-containing protein n=1 Tax=Hoeflea algicola TaxID=2983763 RepID=A0ABT3ZEU5_9HYPH|nr:DUF1127 domain-containing protein [Hoeflea algicola]MCY0150233.1 DUF1127 domain-containing protein [Hoeflea algicola]
MNVCSIPAACTSTRPTGIGMTLLKALLGVAGRARTVFFAMVNRRTARKIQEMPDWQLADIGLTRQDMHDVLSRPVGTDPLVELADRARFNCRCIH